MLPRLSEPESYQKLKHGYARGFEALQLVDNVRNYYDILARMEPRPAPLLPAAPQAPEEPAPGKAPQLSTKGTAPGR